MGKAKNLTALEPEMAKALEPVRERLNWLIEKKDQAMELENCSLISIEDGTRCVDMVNKEIYGIMLVLESIGLEAQYGQSREKEWEILAVEDFRDGAAASADSKGAANFSLKKWLGANSKERR